MNHELRCYLRLRLNIPNEILLLMEKYLWQLKLAPINLKISFMYRPLVSEISSGLSYLHLTSYQPNMYRRSSRRSGSSKCNKSHHYGPRCLYNSPFGTCLSTKAEFTHRSLHNFRLIYTTQ